MWRSECAKMKGNNTKILQWQSSPQSSGDFHDYPFDVLTWPVASASEHCGSSTIYFVFTRILMSSTIRDLTCRSVYRNMARCLGSLDHFLQATDELMKFADVEKCELLRHGPKLISLMEIACDTLRRNVGLCLLVLCPEEHVPCKAAYFKLLVWIRAHRAAFPVYMDARISLLLEPIEHNLVLRTRGIDPRTQLGIPELIVTR